MGELEGKVAIVTGAGRLRGIGRAAAVALAEMGADVVITGTGRDPSTFPEDEKAISWKDIESVAQQVCQAGGRALPLVADVSDSAQVQKTVEAALSEFGRLDILVNNAAFARGPDRVVVAEMDESIFRRVLEVKVVGSFLMCKKVVPIFIEQGEGGRIVNISSIAGKLGTVKASAYVAANAALQGFTQSLAKELGPYRITVNAVCPGITDTSRMDDLGRGELWQQTIKNRVPLQRAATDEEIAGLIAFLCTSRAEYINGQLINMDGGIAPW